MPELFQSHSTLDERSIRSELLKLLISNSKSDHFCDLIEHHFKKILETPDFSYFLTPGFRDKLLAHFQSARQLALADQQKS